MPLFEEKCRTRTAPKRPGEGEYTFYDSTARKPFDVYRSLLNAWIDELCEDARSETIRRFRTGTDQQYEAAQAEIAIHAALVRQGYSVQCHPDVPKTGHPDFLAFDTAKEPVAYVEVTSFGPTIDKLARDRREAPIYNGLDSMDLPPGWLLGYEIEQFGQASPSVARLKREVREWAAAVCGNDSEMPTKTFVIDDWHVGLALYGGFDKHKHYERKIAAAMGQTRYISPHIEIRQALELKGQKYGIADLPFLIVVADCKGELSSGDGISNAAIEALFGTERNIVRALKDGSVQHETHRDRDGYWGCIGNEKNKNVSAVVILPQPNLWKLREQKWQPTLIRNPWATHPLPDGVLPLPGWQYNSAKNEFEPVGGTCLADLLSLPIPWPPDE